MFSRLPPDASIASAIPPEPSRRMPSPAPYRGRRVRTSRRDFSRSFFISTCNCWTSVNVDGETLVPGSGGVTRNLLVSADLEGCDLPFDATRISGWTKESVVLEHAPVDWGGLRFLRSAPRRSSPSTCTGRAGSWRRFARQGIDSLGSSGGNVGRLFTVRWRTPDAGHWPRSNEPTKLLLLDELSLGLAPLIVQDITRAVAELAARGLTVLLVEQNARAALKISTYGYVLEIGRFVAEGNAERLMNDERLAATHLRSKSDKTILAQ
jgi:hypothetical protein